MSYKKYIALLIATFALATSISLHPAEIISCSSFEQCEATVPELEARVSQLEARVVALEGLLTHFSRVANDVYIDGANLHVRNGLGDTTQLNALGNLVIGYNRDRGSVGCPDEAECNRRTGSHNLVIGDLDNFTSYGGMVVGFRNETGGAYASVTGGAVNTASGNASTVTGGVGNTAEGVQSSVSGGTVKTAVADNCWEGDTQEDC